VTNVKRGGCDAPGADGDSPTNAILNTWKQIMELSKSEEKFFLRYNCPSNVPIPGNDPQVWVRWNAATDDWEDVTPTPEMLAIRSTPADRVRTYSEQRRIDRF
jgi:hypothetical protein